MNKKLSVPGFDLSGDLMKINKGGSARAFFRFSDSKRGPCIFCEYSAEKEENFLYADLAEFLAACGISVPKVYFHDPESRILIMEDVGSTDLLDFSKSTKEEGLEAAYRSALCEAAKIHSSASETFSAAPVSLMPKFDSALYAWEQDYFFDNLVSRLFGLNLYKPVEEWEALRSFLCSFPECLLHRDFQSQNVVMRKNGGVGLIDFQGMRLGLCWYDVASLLYDPYADIADGFRDSLYKYYCSLRGLDPADGRAPFLAAASQRLMQALGAFAFLGIKKGKHEYLHHIPKALRLLVECAGPAGLDETVSIAAACEKCLAGDARF